MIKDQDKLNQIIKDPTKFYGTPELVVQNNSLTPKEKELILTSWREDAKALLRADAENMQADESEDRNAEFVKRVTNLLNELDKVS